MDYEKHLKQVLVVRKDLNMDAGRVSAQVAHAAIKVFFDRAKFDREKNQIIIDNVTEHMMNWADVNSGHGFTKVVLQVKDDVELLALKKKVEASGIPCALMTDNIFFDKEDYIPTCLSIGPHLAYEIDHFTRRLKKL